MSIVHLHWNAMTGLESLIAWHSDKCGVYRKRASYVNAWGRVQWEEVYSVGEC